VLLGDASQKCVLLPYVCTQEKEPFRYH
jgi:hypothetical protein